MRIGYPGVKGHSLLGIDTATWTHSYTGSHVVFGTHVGDENLMRARNFVSFFHCRFPVPRTVLAHTRCSINLSRMKELMNSFRAPGMSQMLGVGLRWRQNKIRRTQNPNIQRERAYPQHQARVCVVGGTNKVRADFNPLWQPSSGSGPQGSLPGIQSPGLPGTVLPPGPNPWK